MAERLAFSATSINFVGMVCLATLRLHTDLVLGAAGNWGMYLLGPLRYDLFSEAILTFKRIRR